MQSPLGLTGCSWGRAHSVLCVPGVLTITAQEAAGSRSLNTTLVPECVNIQLGELRFGKGATGQVLKGLVM